MPPLVSVVVPTYNRAHLIKKSIDSILKQTYQDFEIIVVDDGSTDNTNEVIKSITDERIKYIKHEKNKGQSAARNTGIKAATAEWIALLDSDDIWLQTKLEKQLKATEDLTDEYGVIHCGVQYIDFATGKNLNRWIVREDINYEIFNNTIGAHSHTSTMLIRKKVFDDVGYFDESIPSHEESELSLRIAQKYKYKLVDEFLVVSSINHKQVTSNNDLFIKAKEIILKKHKNILSRKIIVGFSIIIASDSIVKGNFEKAKQYLLDALMNNVFRFKTLFSYLSLVIASRLTQKIYIKRYKKRGWI